MKPNYEKKVKPETDPSIGREHLSQLTTNKTFYVWFYYEFAAIDVAKAGYQNQIMLRMSSWNQGENDHKASDNPAFIRYFDKRKKDLSNLQSSN